MAGSCQGRRRRRGRRHRASIIDPDAFRIAGEWQGRDQTGMAERAVARVEAASSITGESWKFHE